MNLPAVTWTCLLVFVSPLSGGVHGEDGLQSEDYYEDYEDDTGPNSTSYKLNVPDSFQTYLENLLTKENSTGEHEEEKKVSSVKQHTGTDQEKNTLKNKQDLNQTRISSGNSKLYNVDNTVRSLANTLKTSESLHSHRPTIYHPFRRNDISQLLNNLGKGSNVSHQQHHNGKLFSSNTNKNEKHSDSGNTQNLNMETHSKESTNKSADLSGMKLLNLEQSGAEHTSQENVKSKVVSNSEGSEIKQDLQSISDKRLAESADKSVLHVVQLNTTTDQLNPKNAEVLESVPHVDSSVSSPALPQNLTNLLQIHNDVLGKETSDTNLALSATVDNQRKPELSTQRNTNLNTADVSEGHEIINKSTIGIDDEIRANSKQYSTSDLSTKLLKGSEHLSTHKLTDKEQTLNKDSIRSSGEQARYGQTSENVSKTHDDFGNNEISLVATKEMNSLKSKESITPLSSPEVVSQLNQTGHINNKKVTETNQLERFGDNLHALKSIETRSPVKSDVVQAFTEEISNNNTKDSNVASNISERMLNKSLQSTLIDGITSLGNVNMQPEQKLSIANNKTNHGTESRRVSSNSSSENSNVNNKLNLINLNTRLESKENILNSSTSTNGIDEKRSDNTLSKVDQIPNNTTKKHPIADLLDGLVKITTPNKSVHRKRKQSTNKVHQTTDLRSTGKEDDKRNELEATYDLSDTRFNSSDIKEDLDLKNSSTIRVIPNLLSVNHDNIIDKETGSFEQAQTILFNTTEDQKLSQNKLENYINNDDKLVYNSSDETMILSGQERVENVLNNAELNIGKVEEKGKELRSYYDSQHSLQNSQIKAENRKTENGMTLSHYSNDVISNKELQDYAKSSVAFNRPAIQENIIDPFVSKVKESAVNNEHLIKTLEKDKTVKEITSQDHKEEIKDLKADDTAMFSDSNIEAVKVQDQTNLHSFGTNMKEHVNNGTENIFVRSLVKNKENALASQENSSRILNTLDTTSLGSDTTTRSVTQNHPIQDLMSSLVKITSQNKVIKRRKKRRKVNPNLITKDQSGLITENQLQVETDTSNIDKINNTFITNPKTVQGIKSGDDLSTLTEHNSAVDESAKQPLSSYISNNYVRNENVASEYNEDNKLFRKLHVKKQQDANRLAVTNVEESKENSIVAPSLLSKEDSNKLQSFISKYGSNINKFHNQPYESNQEVATNLHNFNNNADQASGASANYDTNILSSKENININPLKPIVEKEDILTFNSAKAESTEPSMGHVQVSSTNMIKTDQNNQFHTVNSNQLVQENGSQNNFKQKTTIDSENVYPRYFHTDQSAHLEQDVTRENVKNSHSNNKTAAEFTQQNVQVTDIKGLEGLLNKLYNVLNLYLEQTNRTNQVRGTSTIINSKKLESYNAIKERTKRMLSKLNDLIRTTKTSFLSKGSIAKEMQNFETNQQSSDGKSAQLLAMESLQKEDKKSISGVETRSDKTQHFNEKVDDQSKNVDGVLSIPVQYSNEIQTNSEHNTNQFLSDESLNKVSTRNNQIDKSQIKTESAQLKQQQGNITNTGFASVQIKPTSSIAFINSNNDDKSISNNNKFIAHQYENQDDVIKQQTSDNFRRGQLVGEDVKLINNLGSKDQLWKVQNQIAYGRDDTNRQYSTDTVDNRNRLEPSKLDTNKQNLWVSNEDVKGLSVLEDRSILNSYGSEQNLGVDYKQSRQENSEHSSKGLSNLKHTQALSQNSIGDVDYSKTLALTKQVSHNQKEMSSDENTRVNVHAELKEMGKANTFASRRSTDPLLKLKKMRSKELKNDLTTNTNTNAQTLHSIDTSGISDIKQKLLTPLSTISTVKNNNGNEYLNSVAEEKSNRNSVNSTNIGQELDENNRLHIIITALDKKPNISVEIGVENKTSSTIITNPVLFKTNNSFYWGGSKVAGESKIKSNSLHDAADTFGSNGNIRFRSDPNLFKLNRLVNRTRGHNKNNSLATALQVSDEPDEKITISPEKLADSRQDTSTVSPKVDKDTSKNVSLEVKDSSKVTNRKKVTKKEEVVEVNEKMKENIVLAKSKTVQTIKTEVSSVDYV